ncbi:IS3 family transposase [Streptomyces sp. NPDC047860]|uniref:IS3 family transposase n=1 Tax=Streptomyces sp. NPDC047860 TaxID=3155743 RepID=UPI0033EE659E
MLGTWRLGRDVPQDAPAHEITVLHLASRHTYGVSRFHAALCRLGYRVNHKRWSGSCASAASSASPAADA